jgi:protein-disulfide isomerase
MRQTGADYVREFFMRRILIVLSLFALLLGMVSPSLADSFSPDQKKELESLIHSYLLEHPEVLREVASALDAKEKKTAEDQRGQVLTSSAEALFHDDLDAVVGNPKGDVTLVEFMDYNCGYCRKSFKEMQAILETDKNVRVVMKEFPIFGEGSEYAARAAMAAAKQGKYWALHQALFEFQGQVTPAVVDQVAKQVGLDVAKMKQDMKDPAIAANIGKTTELAQSMQFTGTPAFLIDQTVIPGYVTKDVLMAAIAGVRANGGCKAC